MTLTPIPIQLIAIADITWPKVSKAERDLDEATAKQLAESIKIEGQHHPILVKLTPDGPTKYEGVTGRHRKMAIGDILRFDKIEARILDETQSKLSDMIRDSENLYRHPLNPAQRALAIKRWHEQYDRQQQILTAYQKRIAGPEIKPAEAANSQPAADAAPTESAAENAEVQVGLDARVQVGPGELTATAEPADLDTVLYEAATEEAPATPPANFAKHVAEKTNTSPTAAKRSLAIGKAFTEDQLEVFSQMHTGQVWMETIAKLPPEQRDHAVNLIASGQEASEAYAAASGKAEVTTASGQTVVTGAADEDKLTDEAWLETHCKEVLNLLPHKAAFKADALFYRHTRKARIEFREKSGKVSKKALDGVKLGGKSYYGMVARLFMVAHPGHWLRCGTCQGNGMVKVAGGIASDTCKTCGGGGYTVKLETR